MSRGKASLGGLFFGGLILMFPTEFTNLLSKFADIFGKIVGGMLLKALGI